MARTIAEAALEKQATEVVILDLRKLDAITDCFVICTGDVHQQVRAIADHIEKRVKTTTRDRLFHREGTDSLNWVVLDYVNVVVHVFRPSFREFYRLENLWSDAKLIVVNDASAAKPKRPTSTQVRALRSGLKSGAIAHGKKNRVPRKAASSVRKRASRTSKSES